MPTRSSERNHQFPKPGRSDFKIDEDIRERNNIKTTYLVFIYFVPNNSYQKIRGFSHVLSNLFLKTSQEERTFF